MFCPYCGERMDADAVFCPRCGERIPSGASEKIGSDGRLMRMGPRVDMGRRSYDADEPVLVPLAGHGRRATRQGTVLAIVLTVCAVVSVACVILLVGQSLGFGSLFPKNPPVNVSSVPPKAESDASDAPEAEKPSANGVSARVFTSRPSILGSLSLLEIAGAEASSSFGTPGDDFYHGPEFAVDGDERTSWQEGVDGAGKGESITLHLPRERKVQALALKLGNWVSEDTFYANHRPKQLYLKLGENSFLLTFADGMTEKYVLLSEPVRTDTLTLVLEKRYQGDLTKDTCISEIQVYG